MKKSTVVANTKKPFTQFVQNKSYITSSCNRKNKYLVEFASYSLNEMEYLLFKKYSLNDSPMKNVEESRSLINGSLSSTSSSCKENRQIYLNERLNYSPREKYSIPEATSWRYGWL